MERDYNTDSNSSYLTGSFRDRSSAERAYNRLRERGYTDEEINIIMSDETRKRYFDKDTDNENDFGNKAMEGAGKGSAIGGAVGATAGIIAAIGTSLVIPGLGVVIAGPIAAGLAGAGAGGLTGGIVGALIGAGIPKDRAEKHEKDIKEGDIVMGVKPRNDDDATYLEEDWRRNEGNVYR
ncbi:MAG: hypothetical protein ACM3UT_04285 [Chloroflexota bacterium]